MSRLTLVCALLVTIFAILAVTESRTVAKDALAGKLVAALRATKEEKKHEVALESESMKKRKSTLELNRKAFEARKAAVKSTKSNVEGVDDAKTMSTGAGVLSGVLQSGKKRGLHLATQNKKDSSKKKSYYEVFMVGDFLLEVCDAFSMAPCTVGMAAFADIMENEWENIDWDALHEDDVEPYVLAFVEWWTENKCTEFFASEHSFYQFVWSIFWDDLEETECYYQLPMDADNTVDWTRAFDKVNSMDPTAWESYPEPTTECELFEMIGEIFFDFFFCTFFDALPDGVLEEIYNDYGVNDLIDPHFGYAYFGSA